jgi:hypothetical protein
MRCGSRRAAWRFIIKRLLCLSVFLFMIMVSHGSPARAAEKWPGVDESVVEKYAKEHGRQAHEPLINTDQGDLLLFVFLLAGSVGGFAAGYYWRILMVEKGKKSEKEAR